MGLRKAMRHAGLLRIDHVMSLQRLFWVPRGAPAREGVYVGYPRAEMFAVLCLEALRAGCTVVGEDLGTVPGEIREEMRRRSIVGMHVLQLEIDGHGGNPPPPPSGVMASLNTHDMPTFAGFRDGRDLDERRALGLLDDEGLSRERARRSEAVGTLRRILGERGLLREGMEDGEALLWGCLRHAAAGPSALLQVSLEDLWLEPHPQNVPGTWDQRPNWKRRARFALEEILTRREVREILEMVDRERRSAVERRS
jgi:4-alpha-glucanotransferase